MSRHWAFIDAELDAPEDSASANLFPRCDRKTYTKPWTVTLPLFYQPDSELLEYMCNENNKDIEHLVGK